jgi:hypothetical protein
VVTVSGSFISSGAKVGRVRGVLFAVGALLVMCLELRHHGWRVALPGRG